MDSNPYTVHTEWLERMTAVEHKIRIEYVSGVIGYETPLGLTSATWAAHIADERGWLAEGFTIHYYTYDQGTRAAMCLSMPFDTALDKMIQHSQQNPTHGVVCACKDQWTRAARNGAHQVWDPDGETEARRTNIYLLAKRVARRL